MTPRNFSTDPIIKSSEMKRAYQLRKRYKKRTTIRDMVFLVLKHPPDIILIKNSFRRQSFEDLRPQWRPRHRDFGLLHFFTFFVTFNLFHMVLNLSSLVFDRITWHKTYNIKLDYSTKQQHPDRSTSYCFTYQTFDRHSDRAQRAHKATPRFTHFGSCPFVEFW